MILFHYTTKASYDEIKRTGNLMKSSPWTTMDSAYGDGWYFTDLGPTTCDMAVAYHCWQNADLLERVQYFLKLEIHDSILKSCRDHVYMISTWNSNLIKYLDDGKNRECNLKPCHTCEKAKKYRKPDPPTHGSQQNEKREDVLQGSKRIVKIPEGEYRPIRSHNKHVTKRAVPVKRRSKRKRHETPPPSAGIVRLM